MRFLTLPLLISTCTTLSLGAGAALADLPAARIIRPAPEPEKRRAYTVEEYKEAHHARVAGGVLIASGIPPLTLGSLGLAAMSRRNVDGSVGNGVFDLVFIGIFAAGGLCELIGIPLAVVGLTGPMNPPSESYRAALPALGHGARGAGLTWSF